jgi:hypothetical protein
MTTPSPSTDPRTVAGMKAAAEKLLPGDPAGQRDMIRNWFRGKAADADLNDPHTQAHVYAMAADLMLILGGTQLAMVVLLTEREETR